MTAFVDSEVVASAADPAGNNVNATFTLSAGTGRKLLAFVSFEDETTAGFSTSGVTFDPGGANEAAFSRTQPTASDAVITANQRNCALSDYDVPDAVGAGAYTVQGLISGGTGTMKALGIIVCEVSSCPTGAPAARDSVLAVPVGSPAALTVELTTTGPNQVILVFAYNGNDTTVITWDSSDIADLTEQRDVGYQGSARHGLATGTVAASSTVTAGTTTNVNAVIAVALGEAGGNTGSDPVAFPRGLHAGLARGLV